MVENTTVCKDELQVLASSNTSGRLERESGSYSSIKNSLNDFVSNPILAGEGWDAARTKIGTYVDALEKGSEISSELGEGITAAVEKLQPFFDKYDSLDPAKLPELRIVLSNLETTLAELPEEIPNGTITKKDESGNDILVTVYVTNPAIAEYEALIAETKELIATLEAFEAACNEVLAMLQPIFAKIDAYATSANSIPPSGIITYIPMTSVA